MSLVYSDDFDELVTNEFVRTQLIKLNTTLFGLVPYKSNTFAWSLHVSGPATH